MENAGAINPELDVPEEWLEGVVPKDPVRPEDMVLEGDDWLNYVEEMPKEVRQYRKCLGDEDPWECEIDNHQYEEVGDNPPLNLVPRKEWGAVPPKFRVRLLLPVESIILSYTGTDPCFTDEDCERTLRELQKKHMEKLGLPDIRWNFMIGGNGKAYEGRGWATNANKVPRHDWWDFKSLDIMYIGRYKSEVTKEMKNQMNELVSLGIDKGYIDDELEHFAEFTDYTNWDQDWDLD